MPGKFTDSLIGENLKVATEYFKAMVAASENDFNNKIKDSGGSIGFIPFKIGFTMDGLSGIKIYNSLTIDTSFLPIGYSNTLRFIVTGVDHKLNQGDWETSLNLTLIPKTDTINKITGNLTFSVQKEAAVAPVKPAEDTNPVTNSGLNNGPGCPDLPGKLTGAMITSKINNAYGSFVKGNEQYIAKLESAYDNFLTKIRSITIIKNGMNGRALIGDSLRSFAFQKQEYDKWVAGGKRGPVLANPCSGYHVAGQAVDLDQGGSYTTLTGVKVKIKDDILSHGILYKSLYDAGLRRVSNEWWHWSIGEANHPINFKFQAEDGSPADYPGATQY
jgi:hypothetical protein